MKLKKVMSVSLAVLLAVLMVLVPFGGAVKADDTEIITLSLSARINPVSKDTILKRINEIRWEACTEGVPLNGRKLTESDYVPIKWSQDMEDIAYIRAYESSISFDHTRPNGQSCFTVSSYTGQTSWGECLAYGMDTIGNINLWYSEKSILVNGQSGVTGHYESLINPNNLYVGIASIGAVTTGEFTSQTPTSEDQLFTEPCMITTDIEVPKSDISYTISGDTHVKPGVESYLFLEFAGFLVRSGVTWKSSNTSVITVENDGGVGVVNASKAGTATITATCAGKSATINVTAAVPTWRKNSRGWWYDYGDGTYPKGQLLMIDGKNYLFDWEGYMVTGWYGYSPYWYYFYPSGAMALGWCKVGGSWYYMDPDTGLMATGWRLVSGKWYYLQDSGIMATGWKQVKGKWYYFNSSGAMTTGWQKIGGTWYYMQDSGAMVTGWKLIDEAWYYFDGSGAMLKGWQKIKGTWYYLYHSGAMATGFADIGGSTYYFVSSGAMATGWKQIDGTWYYFNPSGAMATGWQKIKTVWYYFNGNGEMQTGIVEIDGVKNSFSDSGAWLGVVKDEEPEEPEDPTEPAEPIEETTEDMTEAPSQGG